MNIKIILLLTLWLLVPTPSFAASLRDTTMKRPTVEAVRTHEPITIDGILTEKVWHRKAISGFVQLDPFEGAPASEETEVWVAYDDNALFVAAYLHDSAPDSIVGRIGRRDVRPRSDWFYVALDSYHDRRTGFFFGVTPAGSIEDGILENDDWGSNSWDGVWEVSTRIGTGGWTVEMRIPFSQLRFHEQSTYTWGINFLRRIERKHEEDHFVLFPKKESGFVSRFADLIGIREIKPPKRVEILPYVVSSGRFLANEDGNPFKNGSRFAGDLGADFKIGIGSNLTLDATLNPDFGQAEADPAVINLSQYETFFGEKRPFFLEGAHIFSFGGGGINKPWNIDWSNPQLFYSRRIGRPPQVNVVHNGFADIPEWTTILGAAKLSGKIGDWSVGMLSAVTPKEYARVDSSQVRFTEEVEPLSYYGVVRARTEYDKGQYGVGVIGTLMFRDLRSHPSMKTLNRQAFVSGLDGWAFLDANRSWVTSGWFTMSRAVGSRERISRLQSAPQHYYQRPDAEHVTLDSLSTALSGWATRISLANEKGAIQFNTALGLISPGFEANDLGFNSRADIINAHVGMLYRWFDLKGIFRQSNIGIDTYRGYNFGRIKTGKQYRVLFGAEFPSYWGLNGFVYWNPETFDDRSTRGGPLMVRPSSWGAVIQAYNDLRDQVALNLRTRGSRNDGGGWWWGIDGGLDWKASSQLRIRATAGYSRYVYAAQWVTRIVDSSATRTFGGRYVFAKMMQHTIASSLRADLALTPTLSVQLYLQPLISAGHYYEFKELARPRTFDFNVYGFNGSTITLTDRSCTVDPDGGGPLKPFTFGNPNFNQKSLRVNAVFRWEYMPGSVLFIVWTHNRNDTSNAGILHLGRDLHSLVTTRPDNLFLIKLSYWMNL